MTKARKQRAKAQMSACIAEALESRQMLSGTVSVVLTTGAITITGDSADNEIAIGQTGTGAFTITGVNGTSVRYASVTTPADTAVPVPAVGNSAVGDLTIDMSLGGNDVVTATSDLILGDTTGAKSLIYKGSSGDDSLFPSTGSTSSVAFMNDALTTEVQTITPSSAPDGGTFTLTYNGNTTGALAFGAATGTVQTALRLLPGLSTVTVGGAALTAGNLTVTFTGVAAPLLLSIDTSVLTDTGTPITATVVATTPYTGPGVAAAGTITLSDTAGTAATGTITFASNPIVGDRITLRDGAGNTRTYTAVAGAPAAGQFRVLGSAILTMANLVSQINNASPVLGITASDNLDGSCDLTNDVNGTAGNQAIGVSTAAKTRITVTGMSGGASGNVDDGDTIILNDGIHAATTFTFGSADGEVPVGASAAATVASLVAAINSTTDLWIVATDSGGGVIDLAQAVAGTGGNTTITKSGAQIAKTNFTGGRSGTNLSDGDTVTLDDGLNTPITFTARASSPAANEFLIAGDAARTGANFAAAVNAATDMGITALAKVDGSVTLTNDIPGVFGDTAVVPVGLNVAAEDMAGGSGYSLDCLNLSATMGDGANILSLGAGGSGQSYVYGNLTYTGGADNDDVAIRGAFVGGNLAVTLGAGDDTTGDSFSMEDEGTVGSFVGGNVSITHSTGLNSILLRNSPTLSSSLEIGGNFTATIGNVASGTPIATFENVSVNGAFSYTSGTGSDDVEFLGSVDIGGATTVNLGAGTNAWNSVGTQEVQTLTPNAKPTGGTFTLTFNGATSGAIAYNASLATIQTALRLVPGLSGVTVSGSPLVGIPEVQTVTPTGNATAGTYTLTYGGNTTGALAFNATPATVQTALRLLAGLANILVSGSALSAGAMTFTFDADMGDVATITMDSALTTPSAASNYTFTEDTKGVAAPTDLVVTFPATSGDVSLLVANVGSLTGVVSAPIVETTKGSDFSFGTVSAGVVTYTGLAGADTLSLAGHVLLGSAGTLNLGDGGNSVTIASIVSDGAVAINGGAGADTVTIGGTSLIGRAAVTATLGDGLNSLTVDNATLSGALSYVGGTGNDTVTVGAASFEGLGTVSLKMGTGGTDAATLDGRSRGVSYTGSGTNTLTMGSASGSGGYVMAGALTFTGGAAASTLNFDGTLGNLTYTGGAAADNVNLGTQAAGTFIARGAVKITAAAGANHLTMENSTVRGADASGNGLTYTGGDNGDTVDLGLGVASGAHIAKGVLLTLANGANFVNVDNSIFNSAGGAFTLNGGTGVDTIAFDADGGSSSIFNRSTVIKGGGGADLFTDALTGSVGTKYMGHTSTTKLSFTGFRGGAAQINGSTSGTVDGKTIVDPAYA